MDFDWEPYTTEAVLDYGPEAAIYSGEATNAEGPGFGAVTAGVALVGASILAYNRSDLTGDSKINGSTIKNMLEPKDE